MKRLLIMLILLMLFGCSPAPAPVAGSNEYINQMNEIGAHVEAITKIFDTFPDLKSWDIDQFRSYDGSNKYTLHIWAGKEHFHFNDLALEEIPLRLTKLKAYLIMYQ